MPGASNARHAKPFSGHREDGRNRVAVAANLNRDRIAFLRSVQHPQFDRLILADDAEARRLQKLDPPVAFAFMAGNEGVERRLEAEQVSAGGNIIDDPVGNHEDAANTFHRHVGESRVQRGKQPRAVGLAIRAAALDHAHFDIAKSGKAFLKLSAGLFRLRRAFADRLAPALVYDQRHDFLHWIAVLMHQRRASHGQEQQAKPERAQKSPAFACIKAQTNEAKRNYSHAKQKRQWQKRCKGERKLVHSASNARRQVRPGLLTIFRENLYWLASAHCSTKRSYLCGARLLHFAPISATSGLWRRLGSFLARKLRRIRENRTPSTRQKPRAALK